MKILIVDDEALVRKSLKRAAESRGHEVVEAEDGEQGLKKWGEISPDLVFLDVLMPGLTGPQLLQELPDRLGAITVLMSAYTGDTESESRAWPSYDLFISKPFENIFEVVEKAEKLRLEK